VSTKFGNHTSGFPLHGTHQLLNGSGVVERISAFGRVTLTLKAGEIGYVTSDGMSPGVCQYQAILVQTLINDVAVEATLAPADLALNPANSGTVWATDSTVTAGGGITKLVTPFATALRITNSSLGNAIVYVAFL